MALGKAATPPPQANPAYPSSKLEDMMRMRLRTPAGSHFEHWHAYRTKDGEKVIVLVVTSEGNNVVLEDAWPLFPSDALVTQLRLLEK